MSLLLAQMQTTSGNNLKFRKAHSYDLHGQGTGTVAAQVDGLSLGLGCGGFLHPCLPSAS